MNGSHRRDGVLLLSGAGVPTGVRLIGCHITDVAPTLLQLLDVPVPRGLDGQVLGDALLADDHRHDGSRDEDAGRSPRPYSDEQAEAVGRRLQGLGYQA